MAYCTRCGNRVGDEARVCGLCGAPRYRLAVAAPSQPAGPGRAASFAATPAAWTPGAELQRCKEVFGRQSKLTGLAFLGILAEMLLGPVLFVVVTGIGFAAIIAQLTGYLGGAPGPLAAPPASLWEALSLVATTLAKAALAVAAGFLAIRWLGTLFSAATVIAADQAWRNGQPRIGTALGRALRRPLAVLGCTLVITVGDVISAAIAGAAWYLFQGLLLAFLVRGAGLLAVLLSLLGWLAHVAVLLVGRYFLIYLVPGVFVGGRWSIGAAFESCALAADRARATIRAFLSIVGSALLYISLSGLVYTLGGVAVVSIAVLGANSPAWANAGPAQALAGVALLVLVFVGVWLLASWFWANFCAYCTVVATRFYRLLSSRT